MKSNLQKRLGLKSAIIQAPMAGGPTTVTLVSAVAEAGALGSFGLAYSSPEQIHGLGQSFRDECARRGLPADCGWNANFFVFPELTTPSPDAVAEARKRLEPLGRRVSIDAGAMDTDTVLPVLADQVDAALQFKPSLVSFHLGIPSSDVTDRIRAAGSLIAMSATSVEEAMQVQSAGADYIVAQGYEAGGHRGVFDTEAPDQKLGILKLVETLSKQCELPVVASGGIMNGSDIAAIRTAGADAVQMGTAFLTVDECGSSKAYRNAIAGMADRDTDFTFGFSGRPARGIRNLFIDTLKDSEEVLSFPLQNTLTGSLRKAAGAVNDFELMSLWAGTNFKHTRHCSVAQLVDELEREEIKALESNTGP